MPRDPIKIIVALVIGFYVLWCAADPLNAILMHSLDLAIHEAGHIFFRFFGEFLGIAGGSLLQIIFPAVFVGYFIWHEKPYSAAITAMWLGESIVDVAVYAADAVVMQLPLLGGLSGSEGGFHDWNYLLEHLGLLAHTPLISGLMKVVGFMTIFIAILLAILNATKGEKIFSDEDL